MLRLLVAVSLGVGLRAGAGEASRPSGQVETFLDEGRLYVRAGTNHGLSVGTSVSVLGAPIGDSVERRTSGSAAVVEVWETIARINPDEEAKAFLAAHDHARGPVFVRLPAPARTLTTPSGVDIRATGNGQNPWSIHRSIGTWGLLGTWATTSLVSVLVGDVFVATTILPVFGPLITYARVLGSTNVVFIPGLDGMLILATLLQGGFAAYLVGSAVAEAQWTSHVMVLPGPAPLGASLRFAF